MQTIQTIERVENLIKLLSQQRCLYRQLQELARKQTELVDGRDPEMLLKVLGARQRLIDQLATIDRELAPVRSSWPEISGELSQEQRLEVHHLIDEVQQILGEILSHDEKDCERLNHQKQEVAGEIRGAMAGKRVNQAYAPAVSAGQSRFLDTQSK